MSVVVLVLRIQTPIGTMVAKADKSLNNATVTYDASGKWRSLPCRHTHRAEVVIAQLEPKDDSQTRPSA